MGLLRKVNEMHFLTKSTINFIKLQEERKISQQKFLEFKNSQGKNKFLQFLLSKMVKNLIGFIG